MLSGKAIRLGTFSAAILFLVGCSKSDDQVERDEVGDQLQTISYHLAGGLGPQSYTIDVRNIGYAVLVHEGCQEPEQKDPNLFDRGFCVFPLRKGDFDAFEKATDQYRTFAKPLQEFSFEDPDHRPDGKPCEETVTDAGSISLIWEGTEGDEIATFYLGCDGDEFRDFYRRLRDLPRMLPAPQEIIGG